MIGNNYASYRSDDLSNRTNNTGENHSLQNNQITGEAQGPVNLGNHPLSSGPGSGAAIEGQGGLLIGSVWNDQGQENNYIQSVINPQNRGPREWDNDLSATLDSPVGNQSNFGGTRFGSFSNLPNQDWGGHSSGHVPGALEYPHLGNSGSSGNPLSAGGSLGSMSSGGGGSNIPNKTENGDQPVPIPEPSTLTLAAIGLLLLARAHSFVGRSSNTN